MENFYIRGFTSKKNIEISKRQNKKIALLISLYLIKSLKCVKQIFSCLSIGNSFTNLSYDYMTSYKDNHTNSILLNI